MLNRSKCCLSRLSLRYLEDLLLSLVAWTMAITMVISVGFRVIKHNAGIDRMPVAAPVGNLLS